MTDLNSGNLAQFLPSVCKMIQGQVKHYSLLLDGRVTSITSVVLLGVSAESSQE